MISHVLVGLISIFSALFYRYNKTINCLNTVHDILYTIKPKSTALPTSALAVYAFLMILLFRMLINHMIYGVSNHLMYYPYFISYFVPIVVQNIVAVLSLVAENAYKQINYELEMLIKGKYETRLYISKIKMLTSAHAKVTDYVNDISECFGVDMLFGMIDNFIQFVLFLYLTLWTLFAERFLSGSVWPYISGSCEIITISSKILYICYRCNQVVTHVSI